MNSLDGALLRGHGMVPCSVAGFRSLARPDTVTFWLRSIYEFRGPAFRRDSSRFFLLRRRGRLFQHARGRWVGNPLSHRVDSPARRILSPRRSMT